MQTIIINFAGGDPVQHIKASQYDGGTRVRFLLMDGAEIKEIPEGHTVHLMGKKPDRTIFDLPCVSDGCVVDAELTQQATIIAGRIPVELVIIKDEDDTIREGSKNLVLDVERAPVQQDDIESTDEYISLTAAVASAEQAAENAAESAETAEAAAERIPTVTVEQTETGATITVTDSTGQETSAQLVNGQDGRDGRDGRDGQDGETGPAGPAGSTGPAGPAGKSAYQAALDAGYDGTTDADAYERMYVSTLRGADESAVSRQIARQEVFVPTSNTYNINVGDCIIISPSTVKANDVVVVGYAGTVEYTGTNNKVASLVVDRTLPWDVFTASRTMSKEAIITETSVHAGMTEAAWAESLQGADGQPGTDGKSAADIAAEAGIISVPEEVPVYGCSDLSGMSTEDAAEQIENEQAFENLSGYVSVGAGDLIVISADGYSLPSGEPYVIGYVQSFENDTCTIDKTKPYIVAVPESTISDIPTEAKNLLYIEAMRGADGEDGADGADGHTPVKGTDYWTAADQAAIVQDVLDALPDADTTSY